ncbi:AMP-binding protein [Actinocrispum wychmicini]|uniref:Crotonobetaine/carnitine-CoA ligase n=1 Tax=Actinocrispum wychmicini TaxID=1213861 RepID=A0A4R2JT22_9PSEU|nr:AMP-binding protein [Actinocrispum wychmicini]TCO62102.1 crotonobetaine/carnitine-CoA ligase [Actinocrispum wychmicini]
MIPPAEDCVLPALLAKGANAHPERTFAVFDDDVTWTYGDAMAEARRTAAGLRGLGVEQDDPVLVWLPNGPDVLRTWFGINLIGAVYVPINLAYKGNLLRHVVTTTGARVAVVHPELVDRLRHVDTPGLDTVVVLGDTPAAPAPWRILGRDALDGDPDALPAPDRPVQPWDLQTIMYTSGTTGPSKGVRCPHLHAHCTAVAVLGRLGEHDRYLVNTPFFHGAATLAVNGVLALGASMVVSRGFDTKDFWNVVRRTGTTACTLLGAPVAFLSQQPPRADDTDNPLRFALTVPLTADAIAFAKRFDVQVLTVFNMTETSNPLVSEPNPTAVGSCGRPRPGVEVRLVDEHDREVAAGEVGELIVRADLPWSMNAGYHAMPEATAHAWRNGWFHTGDLFRRDGEDNFFFVDRAKDAIRRRGENISSFEVEAELLAHPAIREAAVVGVPSEHSEEEVLAVLALADGHRLDPADLIEHLRPRLAHFMIPRYVRFLGELPRTPSAKVEKHKLRTTGLTADTWDREAAGIRVHRDRISHRR